MRYAVSLLLAMAAASGSAWAQTPQAALPNKPAVTGTNPPAPAPPLGHTGYGGSSGTAGASTGSINGSFTNNGPAHDGIGHPPNDAASGQPR